ncbi:hypothetical protein MVEN_02607200 [Mycena venus]|uniref:Uncharacterized protein n=1 Tax=Mycena venus TaxID=2733690 RepID=A0A8H6U0D8_9AGAR|nr:hypothetical protein MVEN_02607200 [Mycena venus]
MHCKTSKAIFLSQHIEISGLRTETFEDCMRKLTYVREKFGQQVAGVPMANLIVREGSNGSCFSATNHIFSRRSDVPTEQDNEFQDGVDSIGRLAKLKGTELIHAPENIVKYYRVSKDNRREHYAKEIPGAFKAGDIVEAQVAFVAIMSHGIMKVTNRLQALTLVDDCYSKASGTDRAET